MEVCSIALKHQNEHRTPQSDCARSDSIGAMHADSAVSEFLHNPILSPAVIIVECPNASFVAARLILIMLSGGPVLVATALAC